MSTGLHLMVYTDRSIVTRGEQISPLAAAEVILDITDLFGNA